MHEFALMADLLRQINQVAQEHQAKKVTGLDIWIGALAHICAEHFREHFEEGAKGGIADGATLEIEVSDDINHPQAQNIMLRHLDLMLDKNEADTQVANSSL